MLGIKKKAYVNGKIYTVDPNRPWAEAIITVGDKIAFVGNNNEIAKYIDDETEIIELKGDFVLPGFIDSHTHLFLGGITLLGVDLSKAESSEEFVEELKKHIETKPGKWVIGGNWNHQNWKEIILPQKEWVDSFSKDTPIFVHRMDYHMAFVNSAVLKIAGITKDTPDPTGGIIERDKLTGEPTGILKDKAVELVWKIIPEPAGEELEAILRAAFNEAKRLGVTSVHDVCYNNHFKGLQKFRREEGLTCRVNARLPLEYIPSLNEAEIEHGLGDDILRLGSLKAFADGALGSGTALFFQPYTDDPSSVGIGSEMFESGKLHELAKLADKSKWPLSIHAIGDKAISEIIDLANELSTSYPQWDRRFRLEHAQHIAPKDIPRLKEESIIVSGQPCHHSSDGNWALKKIGSERLRWTYAFKSFLDSGAKLCFGSDWPVVTLDPIQGIHSAVTRETFDGKFPDGLVPEEKISVKEAIECYTINGAYAEYAENKKGSISVGKLADFVILSANLFEIPEREIKNQFVKRTVFNGDTIYII